LLETEQTFGHLLDIFGLQLPGDVDALVRGASDTGPSAAAIEALLAQRAALRRQRHWADADAIRRQLADQGVTIEDRADTTVWRRG
jgi:cysteinyl-tRNA synthetase